MPLLLHRGRLGITLGHDDAAQIGAVLTGHLLPCGFALVFAEVDLAALVFRVQGKCPSDSRAS